MATRVEKRASLPNNNNNNNTRDRREYMSTRFSSLTRLSIHRRRYIYEKISSVGKDRKRRRKKMPIYHSFERIIAFYNSVHFSRQKGSVYRLMEYKSSNKRSKKRAFTRARTRTRRAEKDKWFWNNETGSKASNR